MDSDARSDSVFSILPFLSYEPSLAAVMMCILAIYKENKIKQKT